MGEKHKGGIISLFVNLFKYMYMLFLYPSVKHASYISERPVASFEVLKAKELLVSASRPSRFYQVVKHEAYDLVTCIDQDCNTVSLPVDAVRVVNWYE